MNRFLYLLFIGLTACTASYGVPVMPIPNTDFSLALPATAIVHVLPPDVPNYQYGIRTVVSAYNEERFNELTVEENAQQYFSLYVHEGKSWEGDINEWLDSICVNPNHSGIERHEENAYMKIWEAKSNCAPSTYYGLQVNNRMYLIVATQDVRNEELLWQTLQTAKSVEL